MAYLPYKRQYCDLSPDDKDGEAALRACETYLKDYEFDIKGAWWKARRALASSAAQANLSDIEIMTGDFARRTKLLEACKLVFHNFTNSNDYSDDEIRKDVEKDLENLQKDLSVAKFGTKWVTHFLTNLDTVSKPPITFAKTGKQMEYICKIIFYSSYILRHPDTKVNLLAGDDCIFQGHQAGAAESVSEDEEPEVLSQDATQANKLPDDSQALPQDDSQSKKTTKKARTNNKK